MARPTPCPGRCRSMARISRDTNSGPVTGRNRAEAAEGRGTRRRRARSRRRDVAFQPLHARGARDRSHGRVPDHPGQRYLGPAWRNARPPLPEVLRSDRGRLPSRLSERARPRSGSGQVAYRFPRLACSRSIASKSALKLPLPNPWDPCRSISSKNTVGRSWTGWVKICSR